MYFTNKQALAFLYILTALTMLLSSGAFAQTTNTWTGQTSSVWHLAANWSLTAVPSATDDVVIPSGTAYSPILSTTALVSTLEVQSGASLSISTAGSLTVNGSKYITGKSICLFNAGTISNQGQLAVDNTRGFGEYGLYNTASFSNLAGGTILIDRVSNRGLYNASGSFVNSATVVIGSTVSTGIYGVYNAASFSNAAGGIIQIDRADNSGVYNASGSFVNSATVVIGSTASTGAQGVYNAASFSNTAGGIIQIDRFGDRGLYNAAGSSFVNSASLVIGSTTASTGNFGLQNESSFTNTTEGIIQIDQVRDSGILNASGSFVNSATVTIGSVAGSAFFGLRNESSFTNTAGGIIQIDRVTDSGVFNASGSFVNSATVTIGSVAGTASFGLQNASSFTNTAGGVIQIDRVTSTGLYNPAGSFVNSGTITIGSVAGAVYSGINNASSFTNTAGGIIQIDRVTYTGIKNNYNPGNFVNSGTVTISSVTGLGGHGIENGSLFTNTTGGIIQIDRSNGTGLLNSSGRFVNSATIMIGLTADINFNGINNAASFTNTAGGIIQIDKCGNRGLSNIYPTSTFINSATLSFGTSTTGIAIDNSDDGNGTFTNQGCTALITSSGNAVISGNSSFSNTGTIIENATGTSSVGYNGGLVQNLNGGTFTVGSGNPAITTAGLIWRGCVSSNWNTAANWSAGRLPAATDDVTIPSGTAYSPVLSTTATAKSVDVQSGASFTISTAGSLSITSNKSLTINNLEYTISFFNGGIVVNQGALSAGNTAQIGLYNTSSFSNLTGGSITIDGTSSRALFNNTGTFVNAATIRIGSIAGVGPWAIDNQGSFSNVAGGMISIDRTSSFGLFNIAGTFSNFATITIGSVAAIGSTGLINQALFNNLAGGTIAINRSSATGLSNQGSGSFVNSATITLGSLASVGSDGLSNQASFSNIAGGSITIDRSGSNALVNSGSFLNAASITIGTVPGAGFFGLFNQASFTNAAGGSITIDRTGNTGLVNGSGSFVNAASIRIGTAANVGFAGLSNATSFSNLMGGSLTIDRTTNIALSNNNTSIVNQATITIGTSATGTAISNGGVFNNQGCTALLVSSGNAVISGGSSFSNTGTIIESATGTSGISYNGGLVQNLNGGTFNIGSGQPPLSQSATNLTTCNPANGSFTIAGVQPATAYTLSYTLGNTTASSALTGNGSGQLITANLGAGVYALALSGSCVAQSLPLSATLNVPAAFTITTQPPATSLACAGASVSAAVGASGTTAPVTYQWYKNSLASPVASQTAATLSLTGLTTGESGSYFAVITDNCTSATSATFSLTVATISNFTVSSATVCPGQSVNLTASGCSGQILWSTGATTAMITLTAGNSTSTLSATCTTGVCSAAVTGQVVVGGIQPPPAQILSFTADESACPVRLTGRGIATSFTMTGPNGYVFSTVFREGATHEAIGLNVKQPGNYTLTATYTNSCGTSTPVTRSVAVSRSCP